MNLDSLDIQILRALVEDGRKKWADLATDCGVSAPAIADRVRRLEQRGIIQGYTARLSPVAIGYGLMALISVTLERPEHRATLLAFVQSHPAIQECHHVTGDGDYLLKVRCRSTADLEELISEELKGLPGISQTRTAIALSTVKETTALPLDTDHADT
ncbi:MAG: Lrp/AsnC family transcriptional regulator [Cyanobacteria bacterium J06648_16]